MSSTEPKLVQCECINGILVAKIVVPQMRDAEVVNKIRDELIAAIRQEKPKGIVLNLGELQFVGSVGFLAFLSARREASVQKIVLCHVQPNVREIFAICRLISDSLTDQSPFYVQPDVPSAIATLR